LSYQVLLLVLTAAVIHACWNAWLKLSVDRLVAVALMGAGWASVSAAVIPFVAAPAAPAWPYLAASVVLHTAYTLVLVTAYRLGDLSVAYPIARGTAPLIVTVVSVVALGETIGTSGTIAVMLIVAGCIGLGHKAVLQDPRVLFFSLLSGVLIATYTILDGLGGRASGSAYGFAAWLFFLSGIPLFAIGLAVYRGRFVAMARPFWLKGFAAGAIAAFAYGIVIWAMSAAPMGLVAAVRESSVAFVALLSGVLLRERVRWVAVASVLVGIALVRLVGN